MTGRIRCRNLILAYNSSLGRRILFSRGRAGGNVGDTHATKQKMAIDETLVRQSNESPMGYELAQVEGKTNNIVVVSSR